MAVVRPFRGLRPRAELACRVAAPPYDVLDSDEAREMVQGNPLSILHVTKPEVDLDRSIDLYDDRVYEKGRQNLQELRSRGVLQPDTQQLFYFYRQIMDGHSQTGLVACASIEDYEKDVIRKHEFTRKDKEVDRMRHIEALNAQVGPVFLTYPDVPGVTAIQTDVCGSAPDVDFTSPDGVQHTLWVVSSELHIGRLAQLFAEVPTLYVADGHHRSAAATLIGQKRRAANPAHSGEEEYNFFLAVIFPKSHMRIMPYNRVLADLNGHSPGEFMALVRRSFAVTEGAPPSPAGPKHFSMYIDGRWLGLEALPGSFPQDDPVLSLDVSILQNNLLSPVLGIEDPRTSRRINFVGGIRGTGELERLVDSEKYALAFSLFATTMDQLLEVADSGNVMPPKSTWFEPKLRSGLVIHEL
jgi:uncharacterized protein (DUF1015 family)